ncbi:MAG: hypothetical protein GX428_01590 [Candidatus Atribacteria bacterium]|nr:hypothetical protein [Candidatus Atribacteria bacterium]
MFLIFSGCLPQAIQPTPSILPSPIPLPHINTISPQSGLSGTKITITGSGFGAVQEQSLLILERGDDKIFEGEIITWSDTTIDARVPQLMKDTYQVFIIVNGIQSNEVEFKLQVPSSCPQCAR